jgi:hypothetical protein
LFAVKQFVKRERKESKKEEEISGRGDTDGGTSLLQNGLHIHAQLQ